MANSPSGDSMTARLVRVLDTFSDERTHQSVAEIGRRADLPRSSAHRIVEELVATGLLERARDGRVRLGLRLWRLALRGSRALRLRQAALPAMEAVQAQIRQHTHLAVLEQDEALFLERLSHPAAGSNLARIAGRLPLHATSSGIVLLADAPPALVDRVLARPLRALTADTPTDPAQVRALIAEARDRGCSVTPGSVEAVSTGVAVPIRVQQEVVAALSVVLPRGAPTEQAVAVLRSAARGIEVRLRSRLD